LNDDKDLEIPAGWSVQIQEGENLGAKLEKAVHGAFADGVQRIVVLGSDSPTLPFLCVEEAFDVLARYDAVLGPSLDGGYYLIGCSKYIPEVFKDISWGKSTVLRETAEALNRAQCSFSYLIDWYDIDTDEDLMRLREEIGYFQRQEPNEVPERIAGILPEEVED
jgi:rSAM/selenodomain-associated transferase 1